MKVYRKQKETKEQEKADEVFNFSIRNQMMMGFCIPILFLIIVGTVSYNKAAASLTENYENSTINALEMTRNLLDSSFRAISQKVMELEKEAAVRSYVLGTMKKDSTKKDQIKGDIKNKLSVIETSSDIIQNIHVIPTDGEAVLTTKTIASSEISSFIGELKASEDSGLLEGNFVTWSSSHPCVDEKMEILQDDYIVFCSQAVHSGETEGLIVIDVSAEGIRNLLGQLDFGEGSQISFVTGSGKEIHNGAEIPISETDFFQQGKMADSEWFTQYVTYEGEKYFYMMCRSDVLEGYIAVLVPEKNIVQGSVGIRRLTLLLVISATALAVVLGCFITAGISRNIKKSEASLKRVAEGELYLPAKSRQVFGNEFGRLHEAIRNTIEKMRCLVVEVMKMMRSVSDSGCLVNESGRQVSRYVQDMNEQMVRVENIMESESVEIRKCNCQMERLSDEIEMVSSGILETIEQIRQSRNIVSDAQEAVESMTRQTEQTTQATGEVQRKVSLLGEELDNIACFAGNIQDIASQTNLLSLNASIEAARAGENGRGFAVVAEEIRKLADSAGTTAASIQEMIWKIRAYSKEAVEQVETAEQIVVRQEASVENAVKAFETMNLYLEKVADKMQMLTEEVEGMDTEREITLASIYSIGELSGELEHFSEEMKGSLRLQVKAAEDLSAQAERLKENMGTLKEAIQTFKVDEGELSEKSQEGAQL